MPQYGDNIIEIEDLKKSFGEVHALRGVDMNVPRNSIFGFLGPNGAGKTTLMKILLGLIRPTDGRGTIFGDDIITNSVSIRERIGYLPQQPRFIEYMTARENLVFALKFFIKGPRSKIRERCDEMLELVGLKDKSERPIKGFSGGEKQRLGIALAQVNYPELLILDEPASSLDPIGRHEVLDVMARLRKNTTIFYSTHILDDVQRISDSVAILNRGQIAANGPIERILNADKEIIYTLTLKGYPEDLCKRLSKLHWITYTSVKQIKEASVWSICVNNQSIAEANLLRHVLEDSALTVIAFNRKIYELEDVFLELVKGEEDGR